MKTIVLAGGGTAGHILPNIALLPYLKDYFSRIVYIGGDGMEKELIEKAGLPFFQIPVVKFDRIHPMKNLKIPSVLKKGTGEAEKLLSEIRPDVIFTKGGYASVPVALAGKKLKIPVATHESDQSLGLANKLISSFSETVFVSNPEVKKSKEIYTGNPVRQNIFRGNGEKLRAELKLSNKPTVLVTGGSLGAAAINGCIEKCLDELLKNYNVTHLVGKNNPLPKEKSGYAPRSYAENIEDYFDLADIVITRAGAGALQELTALGKRTIAIPLPKDASRGDQLANAKSLEKEGYIHILYQEDMTPETLLRLVDTVLKSPRPKKNQAGVNAGRIIAEKLNSIAKNTP